MFAFEISFEWFQTVARWNCQLGEFRDGVELSQLSESHSLNVIWERFAFSIIKKEFGFPRGKRTNHALGMNNNVKRYYVKRN
jgi:hypothetical protein